jgi:hypothetical protein
MGILIRTSPARGRHSRWIRFNQLQQSFKTGRKFSFARSTHGCVTDLAPRPRFLVVDMQVRARHGKHLVSFRQLADEINHGSKTIGSGTAQWQPKHCTQVIFELAGHGPFDGPVA